MKILSKVHCLFDRKSNSEINLTDSLTVWPVNIISTETLKQMALFFHYTKTLIIHSIVSLQPNGLRIFVSLHCLLHSYDFLCLLEKENGISLLVEFAFLSLSVGSMSFHLYLLYCEALIHSFVHFTDLYIRNNFLKDF